MSRKSSSKPISDALRMALGLKQKRNLYMTPTLEIAKNIGKFSKYAKNPFTPWGIGMLAAGYLGKKYFEEEEVPTDRFGHEYLFDSQNPDSRDVVSMYKYYNPETGQYE